MSSLHLPPPAGTPGDDPVVGAAVPVGGTAGVTGAGAGAA